jgi:hypothetical protein
MPNFSFQFGRAPTPPIPVTRQDEKTAPTGRILLAFALRPSIQQSQHTEAHSDANGDD